VKNMAEKDGIEGVRVALGVGQYIIDEVERKAAEEAKKELKFKRSLKKYTGRFDHNRK
jgi:hypothetical protein